MASDRTDSSRTSDETATTTVPGDGSQELWTPDNYRWRHERLQREAAALADAEASTQHKLTVHTPSGVPVHSQFTMSGGIRASSPVLDPQYNSVSADPAAADHTGEIGVPGDDVRWGRMFNEYNSSLQSLVFRMMAFEEMRRSEPVLASLEMIVSLPIRQATWRIEDGEDLQLSEAIRDNIFGDGLDKPFDETLRQALLAVFYGFSIHEKVLEYKDGGFLGWRKFAPRLQSTVWRWAFDDHGKLLGFTQYGKNPNTGILTMQDIPIDRLVVWTWNQDGIDPEGIGAFRRCYKPWMYKQAFETFAAIRIERQAGGIFKATGPAEGYDEIEEAQVKTVLENIRIGESAGLIVPDGWVIEALQTGNADVPFETHIERQSQAMYQAVLAPFIGYGGGGSSAGGSFGLSRDLSGLFLLGEETIAGWLAATFNRHVIRPLCEYNGYHGKKPPFLAHGKLGVRDIDRFTRALTRVTDPTKPLPPTLLNSVLEEFQLPQVSDAEINQWKADFMQQQSVYRLGEVVPGAEAEFKPATAPLDTIGAPGTPAKKPPAK